MSTSAGYVRAFIAIDVPTAAREIMAGAIREMADQGPGSVRWVDAKGIHLTLGRVRDRISPGARRRIIQAMSASSPASTVVSEPWMVEEIHLFRTSFTPQGSVYSSMGAVPLARG